MSIKGFLIYVGFFITYIENVSVFLFILYVIGVFILCCILCFFCGIILFRNKEYYDFNLCVFINFFLRFVYVGYCGVLDY